MDRKSLACWPVWKAVAAASFCALLAIAIVYPGLVAGREIPNSTESFGFSDLTDQNLPLRVWGGAQLAHGRLPLWFPGCFGGGMPLAAIPEAAPYYPPSALFYMLAAPGPATAWTIVFHLLIAGVGAAMVARHFRMGLGAQLLAAVLMSVGLHLPAHVRQLNIMQAEAWLPWVWLFLDRLLIRPGRRDAAGLGFSMGMLGLAGHPEILHHAVVIFFAWAFIRIVSLFRCWWDWRFWTGRGLTLGAAALIAGALALPSLGPISDMLRWAHRTDARAAPDLKALALLVRPWMYEDPRGDAGPNSVFGPLLWEESFYIGRLPFAFALGCTLFSVRRRRLRIGLVGLGCASLLLAFAAQYHATQWIPKVIPLELSSRFPHRYLWGFNMALVMMAAFGFDGLLLASGQSRRFTRPVAAACVTLVLLITALDLARVSRYLNPMGDSSPVVNRPETLDVLAKGGATPDRFAERLSNYGILPLATTTFRWKPGWNPNPTLDMEFHRFLVSEYAAIWNWQSVTGYVGMDPFWSGMIMGDNHTVGVLPDAPDGKPIQSMLRRPDAYVAWSGFFGGRWMVAPVELDSPRLRSVGMVPGKYFQAYCYENMAWAGGAWIARDLKTFKSDRAICDDIRNALPDRNCIRMLSADVPPGAKTGPAESSANDNVEDPQWPDPQHVLVHCRLERPGFLVLNQSYYPSWRVRIDDGKPQKTLRVNVCQTAVWLEAGPHRVSFEYPGRLERIGLAIGLIGLLAAAACVLRKNPAPAQQNNV